MKFARRSSSTRFGAASKFGAVVRITLVTVFVASTAMVLAAVTPGVAAASETDWSAPMNVDGSNAVVAVSCASSLFCAAVDLDGNALTYNGSSWSAPDMINEGDLFAVSCPSATFCVAGEAAAWKRLGTALRGPRRLRWGRIRTT